MSHRLWIYDWFNPLKIKKYDDNSIAVLITGDLTKETENKTEKLKALVIIYKPFKIDKLLDVIRWLEKISW